MLGGVLPGGRGAGITSVLLKFISLGSRTGGHGATSHCPDGKRGGTVGLSTVTPRISTVFCLTYLLKSEIIATVIAAIHPALALPQALCWVLWPGDQFLDVGLITPFELLGQ